MYMRHKLPVSKPHLSQSTEMKKNTLKYLYSPPPKTKQNKKEPPPFNLASAQTGPRGK